jgi:glycosyltransferase involved in cell wall biosynthesis
VKVALFVHCFFPAHFYGTEKYTLDVARNLRALGHSPVVVTAVFPGEPAQAELLHRYEFEGIPVVSIDKNRLPNTRVKDTYYQPQMAPVLEALLDELAPDVVHVTHLINHTAVLLEVLARRGVPVVATFTDFFGFCYTNKLEAHDGSLCAGPATPAVNCLACHLKDGAQRETSRRARLLRRPAGAASAARAMYELQRMPRMRTGRVAGLVQDLVQRPRTLMTLYRGYHRAIAPTSFIRKAYEGNGYQGAMVNIPFGVDLSRAAKQPRDDKRLVLGFVGQIMAHKGPDILIEAARRTLDPGSYEIRIMGSLSQDAEYGARLQRMAQGLPVRFLGTFPQAAMRDVLDDMDALVIPSRWYENSPLVLLNALASHTPVIVSDVAGMTEFVREGVNGFAFERGSVEGLAAVLRRIAGNPETLHAMAATTHYDMTTLAMTERTLEVYEHAIADARAAGIERRSA